MSNMSIADPSKVRGLYDVEGGRWHMVPRNQTRHLQKCRLNMHAHVSGVEPVQT
jgi:hypothetical protein